MKTQESMEEKRLAALMKKSLQQPPSTDFDDRLMEKIIKIPATMPVRNNGSALQLGKRYLIMACIFLLVSVFISGQFLGVYFNGLNELYRITTTVVFYGGMALIIPVLLFVLDTFLKGQYALKEASAASGF